MSVIAYVDASLWHAVARFSADGVGMTRRFYGPHAADRATAWVGRQVDVYRPSDEYVPRHG